MGIIDIALITIIIAASVAYIAMPIIKKDDSGEIPVAFDHESISLEEEKEESYNAIKEAEFDYETGKLSEEDYSIIKEKYAGKAVEAMQKLEENKKQEKQIPAAKAGQAETGHQTSEKKKSKTAVATCAHCGAGLPSDAKFCQSCGKTAEPQAQANFCPKCGEKHKKGAKFCQSCGQHIK